MTRAKEFYDLCMGSMTDEEYTSRFLELLIYVPYLREEKAKVQRFISGMPVAYKYRIEFDEPRSLEEAPKQAKEKFWRVVVATTTEPYTNMKSHACPNQVGNHTCKRLPTSIPIEAA